MTKKKDWLKAHDELVQARKNLEVGMQEWQAAKAYSDSAPSIEERFWRMRLEWPLYINVMALEKEVDKKFEIARYG